MNAEDGTSLAIIKHNSNINGVTFYKDESMLIVWCSDAINLLNAIDGTLVATMKHNGNINGIAFNKDENIILSWSEENVAKFWKLQEYSSTVNDIRINDVQDEAVNQKKTIELKWSWKDLKIINVENKNIQIGRTMKHNSTVKKAVLNKDNTLILSWTYNGTLRLWNARDGYSVGQIMKHDDNVKRATFTKDETHILSWNEDKTVKQWNIAADYDFPNQHLPLMVNVMTGTKMDDYGNVTALNQNEWEAQKAEYIMVTKEHLKTCKYKSANLYLKQKEYWGGE